MGSRNANSTCVIVAICGSDALSSCVVRLRTLRPPPEEIVVSAADTFEIPQDVAASPDIIVVRVRENSPVALAAAGIEASAGDIVCLTEDHCVPSDGWIAEYAAALGDPSCVAAGGPIDAASQGTSFDWAFFIVDFFRYVPPVAAGAVGSLSVCNVAYRRETLEAIRSEWEPGFQETRVHELLKTRGSLVLVPGAGVTSNRRVYTRDGIVERYTFGRLFAATRFRAGDTARRVGYAVGSLLLPFLLFARIAARCFSRSELRRRLLTSSHHVAVLLIAWSLGEFVGYVTGKAPSTAPAAKNRN